MICEAHQWTKKSLPCPYLRCLKGQPGHWVAIGKKQVVYVRRRSKTEAGPQFSWEKTDLNADELLGVDLDDEEDDLLF